MMKSTMKKDSVEKFTHKKKNKLVHIIFTGSGTYNFLGSMYTQMWLDVFVMMNLRRVNF